MSNILLDALNISGIGIAALLLILSILAFVVSLMTRYIKDKPEAGAEEETKKEEAQSTLAVKSGKKSNLQMAAAVALALSRARSETNTLASTPLSGETNSWRQFRLQRRLTQSSTIRRTR